MEQTDFTVLYLLFLFLSMCGLATTYNEQSHQNPYAFRKLATVLLFEKGGSETVYHVPACQAFVSEMLKQRDGLSRLVNGKTLTAQGKLLPVDQLINKDHVGVRGVMDAQSAEIRKAYLKAYKKVYQQHGTNDPVAVARLVAAKVTAVNEKILQLKKTVLETQQLQVEQREQ